MRGMFNEVEEAYDVGHIDIPAFLIAILKFCSDNDEWATKNDTNLFCKWNKVENFTSHLSDENSMRHSLSSN